MKFLRASLLATAFTLAVAAVPAYAQKSAFNALMQQSPDVDPPYELLMKSSVAFWKGMPRAELEKRTTLTPDGTRTLQLGDFKFEVNAAEFDASGELIRVSVEYRNDDPAKISEAYSAYKHALGDIPPDYTRESPSGTDAVPDLQFAMIGWKDGGNKESALARIYSKKAQESNAVSGTVKPAGIVTFAVRGR